MEIQCTIKHNMTHDTTHYTVLHTIHTIYTHCTIPGHDEEHLYEAGAEGQDAAQHAGDGGAEVPGLLRNLSGDVGSHHGELKRILLVAEVGAWVQGRGIIIMKGVNNRIKEGKRE